MTSRRQEPTFRIDPAAKRYKDAMTTYNRCQKEAGSRAGLVARPVAKKKKHKLFVSRSITFASDEKRQQQEEAELKASTIS